MRADARKDRSRRPPRRLPFFETRNFMRKIITLSFDDGEVQDIRVIELLKKYGLQATFYLCSSHIGLKTVLPDGRKVEKVSLENLRRVYEGFEIGSHGENHNGFAGVSEIALKTFIQKDLDAFSPHTEKPIKCAAYPGGVTDLDTIEKLHRLGIIRFVRGIPEKRETPFNCFHEEMHVLPQCHMFDSFVYEVIDLFERINNDDINILHIYGHSYELDLVESGWEKFEKLLDKLGSVKAEKLCNGDAYDIAFRKT